MAQAYTTAKLLASIKRKAMIPNSQATLTDEELLEIATEELQVGMIPLLLKVREEYYVTFEDQAIVQDQETYPIPTRAIGGSLRDILHSPSNPITLRSDIVSLPRIEPDIVPWRQNTPISFTDFMFHLRDNHVVLVPAPRSQRGTLRLVYHRRPADLVKTNQAAQITELTSSNQVTCSSIPNTWDTASTFDFIKGNPGFDFRQTDKAVTNINTTTNVITFAEDYSTDLAVGDWISIAGTAPVAQIPLELQSVLAQRVVVQVLEALGDQGGKASAEAKLREIEDNVMNMITPRVRGEARKITAPNYYKGYFWGG